MNDFPSNEWRNINRLEQLCFAGIISLFILFGMPRVCFSGNELSKRQLEIIQTVMSADGYITKELHSEFWASFPIHIRNGIRNKGELAEFVNQTALLATKFQRECWASIKASLEAGRVMRTSGYSKLVMLLRKSQLPRKQVQYSISNAEGMFQAAASRTPFKSTRGPIYITPELVARVLAGLDGGLDRAYRLINPDWGQEIKEYRYPEAHVAILSTSPFSVEKESIRTEEGNTINIVSLSNQVSEDQWLGVSFHASEASLVDSDNILIQTVKSVLKSVGSSKPIIQVSSWRGRSSAFASGTVKDINGNFYVSVRAIDMHEDNGVLVFMAGVSASEAGATLLREELEQKTQLVR